MATRFVLSLAASFCLPILASISAQEPQQPSPGPVVETPSYPNKSCPIMGKPVSARLFVDTAKGRFWVCCKACYEEILADLDTAHRTAYPEVEVLELEKCPITGNPLPEEPHRVVLQGFDVPVCCPACEPDLLRDSQVHLALLANPRLMDLRNSHCPVTDEAVTENSFCTIEGVLVRLSSPRVLEDVKTNPAKVLASARASVEKHGALPRPKRAKTDGEKQASGATQRPAEKNEHEH
jgi:hypothetical protein